MVYQKAKRKRSRALAFLLFFALIFVALVGLVVNEAGKNRRPKKHEPAKEDNVSLIAAPFEEEQTIEQ